MDRRSVDNPKIIYIIRSQDGERIYVKLFFLTQINHKLNYLRTLIKLISKL